MAAPKRPHYFNSQFLIVRDFQDEQSYHDELLRRHNRLMHRWGVIGGLDVKKSDDNVSFVVEPGSAIDRDGREIILDTRQTLSAANIQDARREAGAGQDIVVTIAFREDDSSDADDKYPGGGENVTRKVQSPVVFATKSAPEDGKVLILARIDKNNGINNSVRTMTSSVIARGSNLGDISLDGALSFTSKSSPNPTYPQVGIDYDFPKDQFRVRGRSDTASSLDLTHLTIKRTTGDVGIGTDSPAQKLEVAGALKLSANPTPNNDNLGVYFWNQDKIGPTIAGFGFEVRTGGNTPRFRISSTGNVGIGTPSSASTRLEVVSSNTALPATTGDKQSLGQIVRLKNDGISGLDIGGASDKGFWLQSTNSGDLSKNYPLLLNPNGGNVGIGTSDPSGARLEVSGALKLGSTPEVTHDYHATYFWNQKDVGPTIGGFGFEVRTNGATARLRINNDGNVGIGTNDPKTLLHIRKDNKGALGPTLTLMNGEGAEHSRVHIDLHTYLSSERPLPAARIICEDDGKASGHLIFQTKQDSAEQLFDRLRLDGLGNVGIGTTGELQARLEVGDTSENKLKSILARLNEGNTYLGVKSYSVQPKYAKSFALEHYFHNKLNSAINFARGDSETGGFITFAVNNGTEQMMLNQYGLEVTGDLTVKGRISCGGKIGLKSAKWTNQWVSARGVDDFVKTHNEFKEYEEFTIVMSCSREFKENISDLSALEAMTTLQNLTPVKYDYKGDKAFRQNLGFIAEDMPDNLCSEDRKSISPFEVVPILTRVAKEQQRVIAELQERVRTLQDAVLG